MTSPIFIASRNFLAIDRAGREFTIILAIGVPYQVSRNEWACAVGVEGLRDSVGDVHGLDSWQALHLAQIHAVSYLTHFLDDGGKLYWPGTKTPVSMSELLSGMEER